jgi:DNA-binding transcriptional ArsR family regulator
LRSLKIVRDPRAFELMANNTRREILDLLRDRELTATQVSVELRKSPQAIYHHLRKLLAGALIEVAKEERTDHCVEAYYRASAQIYEFAYGSRSSSNYHEARGRETLQALVRLGMELDEATASKCVDIIRKIESIGYDADIEGRIAAFAECGPTGSCLYSHIARMLFTKDGQFEELQSLEREIRELLRSGSKSSVL